MKLFHRIINTTLYTTLYYKPEQQGETVGSKKELQGSTAEGNNSTSEAGVNETLLNKATEGAVSTSQVTLHIFYILARCWIF